MVTERANAKINLYLNVVGRRRDGYHNLRSVMQSISLCDFVGVEFRPGIHTSICLEASGNGEMPTDCRNLAWRAAERFLTETHRTGEVLVRLEKHIPMAAGLAGGSTDAAAVLRALNRLCGNPLTQEGLLRMGASLGADVPFCISGGCAVAEGIGEQLTPCAPLPDCFLVVACMGEGVSTPWAYGKLDERYGGFVNAPDCRPVTLLKESLEKSNLHGAASAFYNIFEEVVPQTQPYVEEIKERMRLGGAVASMMSGSGPSVFGVFETVGAAASVCETLKQMGAAAFVCHPK